MKALPIWFAGCAAICLLMPTSLHAQAMTVQTNSGNQADINTTIESLRADIRADKVEVIRDNLKLTSTESAVFWPVYNKYAEELTKVNNERVASIKEYNQKYDSLSDADAAALVTKMLEFNQHKLEIQKKYFKEFSSKLSGKTVAKFFQLEHRFDLVVDVELASGLPTMYAAQ